MKQKTLYFHIKIPPAARGTDLFLLPDLKHLQEVLKVGVKT